MIELPKPPTDNLYKFLAIFGIVLTLGSGAALVAYRDWLIKRYGPVGDLLNEASDSIGAILADRREGRTDPEIDHRRELFAGNSTHRAVLEQERIVDEVENRQLIEYASYGGFVLGLGMVVVGFWLWYSRHQRYEDLLVQLRVSEAQAPKEVAKPPIPPPVSHRGARRKRRR